jgi:hypothetical protein
MEVKDREAAEQQQSAQRQAAQHQAAVAILFDIFAMPPSISSRAGPFPGCGSFLQDVQASSSQHNAKQW